MWQFIEKANFGDDIFVSIIMFATQFYLALLQYRSIWKFISISAYYWFLQLRTSQANIFWHLFFVLDVVIFSNIYVSLKWCTIFLHPTFEILFPFMKWFQGHSFCKQWLHDLQFMKTRFSSPKVSKLARAEVSPQFKKIRYLCRHCLQNEWTLVAAFQDFFSQPDSLD